MNECKWNRSACGSEERCVDLVGSFRCRPCSSSHDDDDDDVCGSAACRSNPCYHGGICQPRQHGGGYTCLCRSGFTGPRCQHPTSTTVQPSPSGAANCQPGQCLNGGRCEVTSDGLARCRCLPPWLGRHCQVRSLLK